MNSSTNNSYVSRESGRFLVSKLINGSVECCLLQHNGFITFFIVFRCAVVHPGFFHFPWFINDPFPVLTSNMCSQLHQMKWMKFRFQQFELLSWRHRSILVEHQLISIWYSFYSRRSFFREINTDKLLFSDIEVYESYLLSEFVFFLKMKRIREEIYLYDLNWIENM